MWNKKYPCVLCIIADKCILTLIYKGRLRKNINNDFMEKDDGASPIMETSIWATHIYIHEAIPRLIYNSTHL